MSKENVMTQFEPAIDRLEDGRETEAAALLGSVACQLCAHCSECKLENEGEPRQFFAPRTKRLGARGKWLAQLGDQELALSDTELDALIFASQKAGQEFSVAEFGRSEPTATTSESNVGNSAARSALTNLHDKFPAGISITSDAGARRYRLDPSVVVHFDGALVGESNKSGSGVNIKHNDSKGQVKSSELPEDIAKIYFRDMGKYDLLTGKEEVELAKRIESGRLAAEKLEAESDLPVADRRLLRSQIKDGEIATEVFIKSNLRLVVSIAKRYDKSGMALLDRIQEGNFGLMDAVTKFDHRKGFKLSTYATWWIRQAITRAIADQSRTIRIPVHRQEMLNSINRAQSRLERERGRKPTLLELSIDTGFGPERITELQRMSRVTESLNAEIGVEGNRELHEVIADSSSQDVDKAAIANFLPEQVRNLLSNLDSREQDVVIKHFGLFGGPIMTLKEIAAIHGLTPEGIRQVEFRALQKLRHPKSGASILLDFIEG